jgi:hypothetical protein
MTAIPKILLISHIYLFILIQFGVPHVFGFSLIEEPLQNLVRTVLTFAPVNVAMFHAFAKGGSFRTEVFGAWIVGTIVFHIIVVTFGAPVVELFQLTLAWSALLSTIAVIPAAVCLGIKRETWFRIFVDFRPRNMDELAIAITSLASILGSWLGAIPIPLDWDEPWQAWPVTLVYGSVLCALLSSSAFYLISRFKFVDLRSMISHSRDS